MIGLLPVNSQNVNGSGVVGVWHLASASAVVAAAGAADASRVKVARSAVSAAALTAIATQNDKVCSGTGLARVTTTRAALPRNVVASATAVARAIKIQTRLFGTKTALALPALARAIAAPVATLINANYLVASVSARCEAIATAHANVYMTFRNAYTVASANATRASLSARRVVNPVRASASATATRAGGVRNRVAEAAGVAAAHVSVKASTVIKFLVASALVSAVQRRATVAFVRTLGLIRVAARALVGRAEMVTWYYVQEPDYRTVFIRNDASTTRMQTFRKQPADVLPYDCDFEEWLAPLIGDDIESAEVAVTGAVNGQISDLTIDQVVLLTKDPYGVNVIQATRLKVWLRGGVHGATYKITVRADTEGGRRKEVDFRLGVRQV